MNLNEIPRVKCMTCSDRLGSEQRVRTVQWHWKDHRAKAAVIVECMCHEAHQVIEVERGNIEEAGGFSKLRLEAFPVEEAA